MPGLFDWIFGRLRPSHHKFRATGEGGNLPSCIFCGAYSTNRGEFNIVWEVCHGIPVTIFILFCH
jgi:hypothetical protein